MPDDLDPHQRTSRDDYRARLAAEREQSGDMIGSRPPQRAKGRDPDAPPPGDQAAMGAYFGYPQCCIDSFTGAGGQPRRDCRHGAMSFGGFVPCHACLVKILRAGHLDGILLPTRRAPYPLTIPSRADKAKAAWKKDALR